MYFFSFDELSLFKKIAKMAGIELWDNNQGYVSAEAQPSGINISLSIIYYSIQAIFTIFLNNDNSLNLKKRCIF